MKNLWRMLLILKVVLEIRGWQCTQESFEKYSREHEQHCKIKDKNDREEKFNIFCDKVQKVNKQNSEGKSWRSALNQFGCMSDEQIARGNEFKIHLQEQKTTFPHKNLKEDLPSTLDYRDDDLVTEVKDQGSCGSCWTFATAACAESWLIRDGQFGDDIDLAEQYLLQCTEYSDCGGGFIEYAMALTANTGIPRQTTYPYQPDTEYVDICEYRGVRAATTNIDLYDLSDDQIKEALYSYGPIVVGISSVGWSSYSSGVFECNPADTVDHAVLAVGWTSNAWIIKNQWSDNWGDDGYIYLSMQSDKNCRMGQSVHALHQLHFIHFLTICLVLLFNL